MIDFKAINAKILAQYPGILYDWFPDGERKGSEFTALNPTRDDKKPGSFSVNVDTGVWSDFSTGDKGNDPISLYAYIKGLSMGDAAKALDDSPQVQTPAPPKPPKEKWTPILPVPDDAPPPHEKHFKFGTPTKKDKYVSRTGKTLGYAYRFDIAPGEKEFWPLTYCKSESGTVRWKWQSFDKPRPLYNLKCLHENPLQNVIVVEGEKAAQTLQSITNKFVVITWPGGGNAYQHAYWQLLKDRKVVLWPDNDEAGFITMRGIYKILTLITGVKILKPPRNAPKKGDAADTVEKGAKEAQIIKYIMGNFIEPADLIWPLAAPEAPHISPAKEIKPQTEKPIPQKNTVLNDAPFRCLGYDGSNRYYHPYETKQVRCLTVNEHTNRILMSLAPLSYWQTKFEGKRGCAWDSALDSLLRVAGKVGVYDPSKIRGCGVWFDDNRVVVHCGNYLDVDGKKMPVTSINSKFIYEAAVKKSINADDPVSNDQARVLLDITHSLNWEKKVYADLLAGWCVIAPISGSLSWRPHIQITGTAGSGKSYVIREIIKPILGDVSCNVVANTTEAGIRGILKSNAFPVLQDEAEGKSKTSNKRMDDVLALMRQASSGDDTPIVKGTRTGGHIEFIVRSCFCIAGISVSMTDYADVSRISVLSLLENRSATKTEDFRKIKERVLNTLKRKYCSGLRSRTISLIRIFRENINTFSTAAAEILGTQRHGDQIGALLAGAHLLKSDKKIEYQQAIDYVGAQDWSDFTSEKLDSDEINCLNTIISYPVTVKTGIKTLDRSISELIEKLVEFGNDGVPFSDTTDISKDIVEDTLLRTGIKMSPDYDQIIISNSNDSIRKILKDSPWAKNWGRILARIPGAETKASARFGFGVHNRAVTVPVGVFAGEDD